MNQLKLIALAHCIPRDATNIQQVSDDSITYTAPSNANGCVGYSESGRPRVKVDTICVSGLGIKNRWKATAAVETES